MDLSAPWYILYDDGCDDYCERQSKVSFCTVTAKYSSAASSKNRTKSVSLTSIQEEHQNRALQNKK